MVKEKGRNVKYLGYRGLWDIRHSTVDITCIVEGLLGSVVSSGAGQ